MRDEIIIEGRTRVVFRFNGQTIEAYITDKKDTVSIRCDGQLRVEPECGNGVMLSIKQGK